ncbi:hypothetical protein CONCODRAFT_77095 [Conidiobolus coronatus NRRL 28638]|uniref:P-loop containing nucleoside triphosphate hydrolase protein n=1 Tax=Conidiobolus coronatus (strain ATCC 28846 / CBS 209.66 / NRRL 28638) TaxID=796925 RepID=A0A137PG21_CONC2|nr:hypothetical protein CONCODRAFT_77095 [Conidiobolus coronatus NRRL 28638]|eukprot:KXN73949.1 hypothetical protein CONCODRAFT_77095 [Conidiobolus coronatus NRRL 28638]
MSSTDTATLVGEQDSNYIKDQLSNFFITGKKRTVANWLLSDILKPELKFILVGLVASLISSVTTVIVPSYGVKFLSTLEDALKGDSKNMEQLSRFFWLSLGLAGLGLIVGVFHFIRYYYSSLAGERMSRRLRDILFANLLDQSVTYFDLNTTGDLINRISSDVSVIQDSTCQKLEATFRSVIECTGAVIWLFALSYKLTFAMICVIPIFAIINAIYGRYSWWLWQECVKAGGRSNTIALESVSNIKTVKSMSQEPKQVYYYRNTLGETYNLTTKLIRANGLSHSSMIILTGVSLGGLLYLGAYLVLSGDIKDPSTLTSFLIYTGYLFSSIGNLSSNFMEVAQGLSVAERVYDMISETSKSKKLKKHTLQMPGDENEPLLGDSAEQYEELTKLDLKGEIELDNVTFHYPSRPGRPILKKFSLKFKPGEVVALVGKSGGGKSSIINLVLGLYNPSYGAVKFDSHNLRTLDPSYFRKQIAIVSQEPVLFALTIKENIAYSVPIEEQNDPSFMDKVIHAAKLAHAHEFIERLPDKYDTPVGERGSTLSGGEKQRIAIARAILQNPTILLLDEATSALDNESQASVNEAIENLMKGKTVIMISHRLDSLRGADKVCVIGDGTLLEEGPMDELSKKEDSHYYHLLKSNELNNIS